MRVLLDSNVWLAVLTSNGACRSLWRRIRGQVEVVAGENVYREVYDKLVERFGFSQRHAAKLVRYVSRQTMSVVPSTMTRQVCRDADDDHILALAVAGGCRFLVTGDEDLLVLGQWEGIRILRPREFAAVLDMESI